MTDNQMPESHRNAANFMTMMAVITGFSTLMCCGICGMTYGMRSLEDRAPKFRTGSRAAPANSPKYITNMSEWRGLGDTDKIRYCQQVSSGFLANGNCRACMDALGSSGKSVTSALEMCGQRAR